PSTLHKYLYVANDPVNKTDPSGLFALAELEEAVEEEEEIIIPMEAQEAKQAIEIRSLIKFLIAAAGIGATAGITEYELRKRRNRPIRLNHYTDYLSL